MFDDTLNSSWDERSRRGLSALTSFVLQGLAAGTLLLFSLFRPAGLPSFHSLSTPVSLGQPASEAPVARAHSFATSSPSSASIFLRPSPRFSFSRSDVTDDGPPQVGPSGPYIPGVAGNGGPGGLFTSLNSGTRPIMPAAPLSITRPISVSHMSEGDLIRKILPTYPAVARSARIQGQVVLQAVISKQGAIENLKVLTGHPMLVPAAIEAVRQWRYRPYILNNEPVEVETQITVNFSLGGN
jgi:periplasmic protein TonB